MTHITPLEHVRRAAEYFAAGWSDYRFNVPEGLDMTGYAIRIRKHARRLNFTWRVVYAQAGRGWIIKQKVVK